MTSIFGQEHCIEEKYQPNKREPWYIVEMQIYILKKADATCSFRDNLFGRLIT